MKKNPTCNFTFLKSVLLCSLIVNGGEIHSWELNTENIPTVIPLFGQQVGKTILSGGNYLPAQQCCSSPVGGGYGYVSSFLDQEDALTHLKKTAVSGINKDMC